jgi:hypothetical protein
MEVKNYEVVEDRSPVQATQPDAAALDIIRTETVLSRLPVHNLAKKGKVNIQILKTTPDGKVELKWEVSYSDRYGQARQLAYKLDTIVINHHIDQQGRPLPPMICLGSLRDVADQLDLGGDTNKVRRALRQNASAFITAKFEYRGNDNTRKTLEADFTRYSVVFTGEQLPDGRRADAVYIILNEPYREVLNNAPVRPLDRAYMKGLTPAAQRFYEIISYKIFSALKNDYTSAKISYSDYCTFSAQIRHFKRQPVQDQMGKVLRPHKISGYITSVRYAPTIDTQNQPDWIMYLTPGPRAQAEFAAVHRVRKTPRAIDVAAEVEEHQLNRPRTGRRQHNVKGERVAEATLDPQLVAEFTRRGVTEKKAREILSHLKPGQDALAQLELGDQHIAKDPGKYTNPAGFYIHLVQENTPLPEGFETAARRKAREEAERRREDERRDQVELETEYQWYRDEEIDRFMAALDPEELAAIQKIKWQEMRETYTTLSDTMIDGFARQETKRELGKRAPLMTIEEFKAAHEQGTVLSSKPAFEAPSVGATITEPVTTSPPLKQAPLDEVHPPTETDSHLPGAERGVATTGSPEPAAQPAISESAIELFSERPEPEPCHHPTQPEADLPSAQSSIEHTHLT